MSVLVIDWLGRGGIAQTAAAWALELDGAGRRVQVLSRVGLELGASGSITVVGAGRGRGPIFTHARVVRRAVEVVRSERPEVVVVHNYLIPMMERPVFRAIREVGSRLVMVVHDHHPHSRLAGTTAGLRAALRQADLVVAHSRFVADGVREFAQVDAEVIPHPIIIETLAHPAEEAPQELLGPGSLALHFGVLKRRYKGLSVVTELAKRRPMGWRIGVVGTGAPPHLEGAVTIPGFLPPATSRRLRSSLRRHRPAVPLRDPVGGGGARPGARVGPHRVGDRRSQGAGRTRANGVACSCGGRHLRLARRPASSRGPAAALGDERPRAASAPRRPPAVPGGDPGYHRDAGTP